MVAQPGRPALTDSTAPDYTFGMDPFLATIGTFLLIAGLLFLLVELWPLAPTKQSAGPGQEDDEPHWHFDESSGVGRQARP
jgi:hypothetical protein